MKKQGFLSHFAVIGAGTFINLLLGLFTTPIITRLVDPDEYGQLSVFTMYSGIALMVLCAGLDQSLVRFYYDSDSENYRRGLLFRCIRLPLILTAVVSAAVITLAYTGAVKFEFEPVIMVLLCVFTALQLVYRFSLLTVRLEYKSKLYSALNILHKLAYIVTVLPMIFLIRSHYLLLLVSATAAAELICVIVSIVSRRNIWNAAALRKNDCTVPFSALVRYGAPYIITLGVTTLFQAIDKLSLNHFCSYSEVGVYSSAMSLVHIFGIIQTTFTALWMPMAVEHFTSSPDDKEFFRKGNRMITAAMMFCGISLILFKDLFAVLLGSKYREAAYILPFLIFDPIMYTVSETTVGGLVFMKRSELQVFTALGACIINIIGNIILVPMLGCRGAAISTGLSYIVFFTLRTVLANHCYPIDFGLPRFYLMTLILSGCAAYNTFVRFNLFSVAVALICYAALFFLYRDTIAECKNYALSAVRNFLNKKNGG